MGSSSCCVLAEAWDLFYYEWISGPVAFSRLDLRNMTAEVKRKLDARERGDRFWRLQRFKMFELDCSIFSVGFFNYFRPIPLSLSSGSRTGLMSSFIPLLIYFAPFVWEYKIWISQIVPWQMRVPWICSRCLWKHNLTKSYLWCPIWKSISASKFKKEGKYDFISHKVTLSLKYMYFFSSNTLKLHYPVSVFMLYICWRLHVILRMQYSVSENKISFFSFHMHIFYLPHLIIQASGV